MTCIRLSMESTFINRVIHREADGMKIGIVGSMNIDKVCIVDRLPGNGDTLLAHDYIETYGGKGANQAVAAARLGGDVTMFGCLGDDSDGDSILAHMIEEGIEMTSVKVLEKVPTGCAFISVARGDNAIVVVPGANAHVTMDYLEAHRERLESMDILLLQNEIPMSSVAYVMGTYGQGRKTIIYDPAPSRKIEGETLMKATWITPNESETASLYSIVSEKDIRDRCLVTLGKKGVKAFVHGEQVLIPAIDIDPVDTTGAGDTFNGALAFALSQGRAMPEALTFANAAAGLSTTKEGAQTGMPTLEEVEEVLGTIQ